MKASLAMEYIIRLMIMLVVLIVVIALIYTFYGDIGNWWCKTIGSCDVGPDQGKTIVLRQALFTGRDVAKYVDSCWLMTGKEYSGNFVCYVLQGEFEVLPDEVQYHLRSFPKDRLTVETDFRGDSAVITFIDLGNNITIS